MGKCPDINHLETSCKAMKRLIVIVINLTYEEEFLLNKDINDKGKLINNK